MRRRFNENPDTKVFKKVRRERREITPLVPYKPKQGHYIPRRLYTVSEVAQRGWIINDFGLHASPQDIRKYIVLGKLPAYMQIISPLHGQSTTVYYISPEDLRFASEFGKTVEINPKLFDEYFHIPDLKLI